MRVVLIDGDCGWGGGMDGKVDGRELRWIRVACGVVWGMRGY